MKDIKRILLALVLISFSALAQNKATETADKLFKKLKFVDAIKAYNTVLEQGEATTYVYGQLAEANYNVYNTEEAEHWYSKALKNTKEPEMVYNYSQMLKANGKYDASNAQMETFSQLKPMDDRAIAFKANNDYLPKLLNAKPNYELKNLDINSEFSEFGGTVNNGILYFSSARNTSRKTYGYKEEPFLDVYMVSASNEDAEPETVNSLNTKYHEGLVTFSPDGNTVYFTRESFYNNEYEKIEGDPKIKFSVQQLFMATKKDDKWRNEEELPFNSNTYSVRNPTMSSDGSTLYFESNMPGGFGMYDIYKVSVSGGEFGQPENLGDKVNTEGQEAFPYISNTNTLYFSSTGHLGIGGLDVFEFKDGSVKNLGLPVNSPADDLAFTINEDSGKGYVSSNREGGKGSDDIYKIMRIIPQFTDVLVKVVNAEDIETPVANALVQIKDENGKIVLSEKTNTLGQVTYSVLQETPLTVSANTEGFESAILNYTSPQEDADQLLIAMNPIEKIIVKDEVVLNPILFDFDKFNITAQGAFELDKLVAVMNKYPEMVIFVKSHTDYIGNANYNMSLSERRAQSTVQYVISKAIAKERITGKGFGESQPKIACGRKCTDQERQTNRRSEFKIVSGGPQ